MSQDTLDQAIDELAEETALQIIFTMSPGATSDPLAAVVRRKRGQELTDEEVARMLIQKQDAAIQVLEGLLSTQRNIKAILEGLASHMLPIATAIEILEVQADLHSQERAREQAYREAENG
jgi:hypothetical protein